MAIRVSAKEVRGIIDTDPDIDMTPFIKAANLLVNRVDTCAAQRGITLLDDELKEIERWLAAHYYAKRDPVLTSEHNKSASASYQRQETDYLIAAKDLDYSGCLAAILENRVASGTWLGKRPSVQIPYADRR